MYKKYKEYQLKIKEDAVKEAVERKNVRNDLVEKYGMIDNKMIQNYLEIQTAFDFKNATTTREERFKKDFQNFYLFSDDIMGTPTGDDQTTRPRVSELEKMAKSRVGVSHAIAYRIPEDAFRNWMSWKEIDYNKDEKNDMTKDILKSQLSVDFYNKCAEGGATGNWAGAGWIVNYWPKSKDKAFGKGRGGKGSKTSPDYSKAPPKGEQPNRIQIFDPIRMTPTNITETGLLDYDEEVWEFTGGMFGASSQIHRDRVHPIILRHYPGDWRGLSVFEPIRLTLLLYFNAAIQYMKGLSKWGAQMAKYRSSLPELTSTEVGRIIDLVDEMRANYVWIAAQGEDIEFADTKMVSGIGEFLEFLKEDISAMTEMPIPYLFGRAVSAGISGAGIVVSERYYMNSVGKFQHKLDDNVILYHQKIGFPVLDEYLRPNWNLSIQKTKEQELLEESMELQNKILAQQLKELRERNKILQLQLKLMEKYGLPEESNEPHEVSGEQPHALPDKSGEKEEKEKEKEDFYENDKRNIIFNLNLHPIDYNIPFNKRKIGDLYD